MTLRSAIYTGSVRHTRKAPKHAFDFPLFMMYLDLSEIDDVLRRSRLWGRQWWRPARYRRADYLRGDAPGLDRCVRDEVEAQLGFRPDGPIRMLTNLRYFGYLFNPVTFYYCFDQQERIRAIVAQITNTPWGERHTYTLDAEAGSEHNRGTERLRWRFAKDFHVSPFLPMGLEYDWTALPPGGSLFIHMNLNSAAGEGKVFDATLRLCRREITPASLAWVLARYPFMTLQVISKIHFEALRLWLKKAPVCPHPKTMGEQPDSAHTGKRQA